MALDVEGIVDGGVCGKKFLPCSSLLIRECHGYFAFFLNMMSAQTDTLRCAAVSVAVN